MKNIKKISKAVLLLSLTSLLSTQPLSFAAEATNRESIGQLNPSDGGDLTPENQDELINELKKRTNEIDDKINSYEDINNKDDSDNSILGEDDNTDIEVSHRPLISDNPNVGVNLLNPPTVLNEGKEDNSQRIKELENSILNASITSNAAKFLLEKSPKTVKNIKSDLEEKVKSTDALLVEAKAALSDLKSDEIEEDQYFKSLKESYFDSKVMLESANILLTTTPRTIKNIKTILQNQVREANELTYQTSELIDQIEKEKSFTIKPINKKTQGLYYATPSEEELINYWRSYNTNASKTENFDGVKLYDSSSQSIYSIGPDINSDKVGELNPIVVDDINHVTNTARYSVGLSEVERSMSKSYYALAASIVNYENGRINHYPDLPKSLSKDSEIYKAGYYGAGKSNIHGGYAPYRQINSYIKDNDKTNWDVVGHRMWLLSPRATSFGYGAYNRYGAAYVFDDYKRLSGDELVAFPSNVAMTEFFDSNTPFSVAFADNYEFTDPIKITMTDLNSGKVTVYESGKNIYINNKIKYGGLSSISWGVGYSAKAGNQLNIKIEGIVHNNIDYPIEYTVNFISLENSRK